MGSGIFGFAFPLLAGIIHQKAVEKRMQEQANKTGYVKPDSPSGEGLLYDIGAWFLDPSRQAERSVSISKRFNLPVWRANITAQANAKKPGETLNFTWDIGRCAFDEDGHQVIEKRTIVYRKQQGGKWVVQSGNAVGTIDLNDIISTEISDSTLHAAIFTDPCLA